MMRRTRERSSVLGERYGIKEKKFLREVSGEGEKEVNIIW